MAIKPTKTSEILDAQSLIKADLDIYCIYLPILRALFGGLSLPFKG